MNVFAKMAERIITEQEGIVGPVALEQARKVEGLFVDWSKHDVKILGNEKDILELLVKQYETLFGRASVEVCKEAVKNIISEVPKDQVPMLLRE